jgi:hypothetical protein
MEKLPDDALDSSITHLTQDLETNFGLSPETARAAAEDELEDGAPAPSSYEVELERIAKANGETK